MCRCRLADPGPAAGGRPARWLGAPLGALAAAPPAHCCGRSRGSHRQSTTYGALPHAALAVMARPAAAKLLLLVPLAAAAPSFTCRHPTGPPTLTLDASTGNYAIHFRGVVGAEAEILGGSPTVTLPSAPYRVLHGGSWLNSTAGGGLVLQPPAETRSGHDQHGAWSAVILRWKVMGQQQQQHVRAVSPSSPPTWVTRFRCYNHTGTVVFTQSFPDGLHDTAGSTQKGRSVNRPSTAFPAFGATVVSFQGSHDALQQQTLGIVTFEGQNAAPTTKVGTWPDTSRGGYDGGPIAVFPQLDLAQGVALLSPLTQFLDTLHAKLFSDDALSFGIGGMITDVPADFSVDFVASFSYPPVPSGAEGSDRYAGLMAQAWMTWGDFLLEHYQQQRSRPDASPWISQLGYSTTGVFHCKPRPTQIFVLSCFTGPSGVPATQTTRATAKATPTVRIAPTTTTRSCLTATPTKTLSCRSTRTLRPQVSHTAGG